MKRIKRLMALLVVIVMVTGMSLTAMAEEPASYSITITQNTDDTGTHTYGAYKIFKGDLENGILSNIAWADDVTISDTVAGEIATALSISADDAKVATKVAKALDGVANNADKAKAFADAIEPVLTTAEKTQSGTGNITISDLTGGYYLIKDTSDPTITGNQVASKTKFILQVTKPVNTVTVKSSVPSVVKKVQDDAYERASASDLQDSADYNIGDTVPYTVTATIGDGIDNFTAYSFQFVDEMSKGLTLEQNSWDIKVGEESIKSLFELSSTAGTAGATVWTWAATDIKAKITAGAKVVLTYNCTLNKDAVIGSAGNPNTVKLKFDNNPNDSGNGTPAGETPEDKNIVFTYKTVFNKVDKDNNSLTGADFKLEKKINGEWKDVTTLGSGDNKPSKTGSTAGSTFTFAGLDDGDYKLTETTTPKGYNTIEPIEFTITAEHEILSDNPALTSLSGTDGAEFTMTPDVSKGSLTANVINEKGAILPSTGGMGTTLFYIIGGALVAVAGILLALKKRNTEE